MLFFCRTQSETTAYPVQIRVHRAEQNNSHDTSSAAHRQQATAGHTNNARMALFLFVTHWTTKWCPRGGAFRAGSQARSEGTYGADKGELLGMDGAQCGQLMRNDIVNHHDRGKDGHALSLENGRHSTTGCAAHTHMQGQQKDIFPSHGTRSRSNSMDARPCETSCQVCGRGGTGDELMAGSERQRGV